MTVTVQRKRRLKAMFTALLTGTFAIAACGSDDTNGGGDNVAAGNGNVEMREFVMDNGDTVEIPVDPQRIVIIGGIGVDREIGLEPVGASGDLSSRDLTWYDDEDRELLEKIEREYTDVGQASDPNYEAIASVDPDLVIVNVPNLEDRDEYENRLSDIAPVVFIEGHYSDWKRQSEEFADATGRLDELQALEEEYDSLVAEIQEDYADVLESTTFGYIWASPRTPGIIGREYGDYYNTFWTSEVGLNLPGEGEETPEYGEMSVELLGDMSDEVDVILYRLDGEGNAPEEFEEVIDSNMWQSLPQVEDGRVFGVKGGGVISYTHGIRALETLKEALAEIQEQEQVEGEDREDGEEQDEE